MTLLGCEGGNDSITHEQWLPRKCVACVYDKEWHIGCFLQHSEENKDAQFLFMKQSEQTGLFSWLSSEPGDDEC